MPAFSAVRTIQSFTPRWAIMPLSRTLIAGPARGPSPGARTRACRWPRSRPRRLRSRAPRRSAEAAAPRRPTSSWTVNTKCTSCGEPREVAQHLQQHGAADLSSMALDTRRVAHLLEGTEEAGGVPDLHLARTPCPSRRRRCRTARGRAPSRAPRASPARSPRRCRRRNARGCRSGCRGRTPPMFANRRNPFASTWETTTPISSMCAASITRLPPPVPALRTTRFPRGSTRRSPSASVRPSLGRG